MTKKFLKTTAVLLLSAGLLASSVSAASSTSPNTGESESAIESTESGVTESGVSSAEDVVYPAEEFELTDQYGTLHKLSDYRGKIVFLNFWATWCPPCRAEMPDIELIYEEESLKEDSDLVILGVASPGLGGEGSIEEISAFLEENGYQYPVLMDTDQTIMSAYEIQVFPTTWLIDREGNLLGYVEGSLSEEDLRDVISQAYKLADG